MDKITAAERIQQAVMNGYKLLAELHDLEELHDLAKSDVSVVVQSSPVGQERAAAANLRDSATSKARSHKDQSVKSASELLEDAKQTHAKSLRKIEEELYKETQVAESTFQATVNDSEESQALNLAAAQTVLYKAAQEVSAQGGTISQNTKNVRDQLGINLANLINLSE